VSYRAEAMGVMTAPSQPPPVSRHAAAFAQAGASRGLRFDGRATEQEPLAEIDAALLEGQQVAAFSIPSATSRAPILRLNDTKASTRALRASPSLLPMRSTIWRSILMIEGSSAAIRLKAGVPGTGVVDREPEAEASKGLDLPLQARHVGDGWRSVHSITMWRGESPIRPQPIGQ